MVSFFQKGRGKSVFCLLSVCLSRWKIEDLYWWIFIRRILVYSAAHFCRNIEINFNYNPCSGIVTYITVTAVTIVKNHYL